MWPPSTETEVVLSGPPSAGVEAIAVAAAEAQKRRRCSGRCRTRRIPLAETTLSVAVVAVVVVVVVVLVGGGGHRRRRPVVPLRSFVGRR